MCGQERPFAGHALECVFAAWFVGDSRADGEVADRGGDEDLIRLREAGDALCDHDGETGDVVGPQLDLPGVQPGANLEPESTRAGADGGRAFDGASGSVEGGHAPIAGGLDEPTTELAEVLVDHLVVGEEVFPPSITQTAVWPVESTMSVNMIVASTRSSSGAWR